MKKLINEIRRFKKIAGLLKEEDIDLSDTPQFKKIPKVPWGWEVEDFDKESDPNDPIRVTLTLPAGNHPDNKQLNVYVYEVSPGKYSILDRVGSRLKDHDTVYDNFNDAVKAAIAKAEELYDDISTDWFPDSAGDLL